MNMVADSASWEGQLVGGRFPLLQRLGSSEHSAVFLTELREPEPRKAVIKLISADAEDAKTRISRWEMIAGLSHPHLLRLFHVGQCEINATQLFYVVLECAEEDLSAVLPLRPLTPAEAGEMLIPIVGVLSYLHDKGLVHGHIKPSNMMVVDNQLKLSCDGIHARGELGTRALESSMYDAPEAASGTILPTADLWSLGVTLVEALTQHLPTLDKWGQGEPILPESVPEPLQDIARKCLVRNPGDRCTLEDILTRLQPTSVPLNTVAGAAATLRGRMHSLLAPAAVVLVVLVVFAGLRLATHHTQDQTLSGKVEQTAASSASQPSPTRGPEATPNTSKGVVVQGAVAERVLPDVPQDARNKIRGRVRVSVRVSVNPAGDVLPATSNSHGRSRYLADRAIDAARGWKFRPPQINGQSVASEWTLRFQFRRTETQVVPSVRRVSAHSPITARHHRHRQNRSSLSA